MTPLAEIERAAHDKGIDPRPDRPRAAAADARRFLLRRRFAGVARRVGRSSARQRVRHPGARRRGRAVSPLPAPRRATGPNLAALCVGAHGAIAEVESASLALVRRDAVATRVVPSAPTRLAAAEAAAWQRVVDAFRAPGAR